MNSPIYQTVIVGGGFTGLFTALHLAHEHYPRSVILIDRNERFCFKPLLYEYFDNEMDSFQVVPRFSELLKGSGVIFVQDTVQTIDLHQREVKLASGNSYSYSNLVLALGSVTGYHHIEGANINAFPFWTQADAIALDRHLRDCLQKAIQTEDIKQRRQLLTVVVVGGGASGVEMAATLADFLPHWYAALGGNSEEIRVILLNHGQKILDGDINDPLRPIAEKELQKRSVAIEIITEAEATAVHPNAVEYKSHGEIKTLTTHTTIWTAGTSIHPLIQELPIPQEHRDHHSRPLVTSTMQFLDFPEVFAGGDCAAVQDSFLPPTAQVAYQQGANIAHNLKALALGEELEPAKVNIRGTLLKLGLNDAAANLFNVFEVVGEPAHLIRQGTYLTLLPTPIHDFQATTEWVDEEIFHHHLDPHDVGKKVVQAVEVVGAGIVSVLVGRKLLKMLGDDEKVK
ncbi:FAD-dependent pyridine nucleotide-disulphide oxidoreductase [Trichormus variabilis ATCC 29413]|uniref:FAD-dependent pyridine nucleotide-disulphide oxidoreductase n=2 Tax=Anabaena variabilis TaxID=264691 RepID=Q3M756_TRIV2|nr:MULTISPECIES: NAD(P)/FAD-dependent oxidoreductase [Nostocaceae]ABA23180.1 FAD-dependent pyridine nucleotide-disulphide oxidoreductase [Trichormus variabilis ATCC 29413]MBC1212840.1 NAD(P)/FAD-dependent oxidoreductase [Trichormus variabilis ARAD]MBC1258071.1 NAD(P)/FAD-dependent oxidoreductase [Trichormus variabilis V5]MBC1268573.1 NAD(P)/FAD-dependent oxidoreductase [Trichormus variabilis FSR]MBC1302969.1 NAD(P)/FAD-dependent oxidoreductase [Trichormus variabilis N2B]